MEIKMSKNKQGSEKKLVRIGNKVDGVKYTKRFASYVIIERKEDKKIAIATEGRTYFYQDIHMKEYKLSQ